MASKILQTLINDPTFLKSVEEKLNSIMADGKVDATDIPEITLLVVDCVSNLKQFKLTVDELPSVIEEILLYIFDKYDVIPDEQEEKFKNMINVVLKLVLLQPRIKKTIKKIFTKLNCCK